MLPSPLARVDFRERESESSNGDIASQLNVSSTSVDVKAMGCTADTASLNFVMGNIDAAAFDNSVQVGEAQKTVTLSCEPGTNVTLEVQAPAASCDTANNTVIALSDSGAPDVATGIGVQLNLKLASGGYDSGKTGLPMNTPIPLLTSRRSVDAALATAILPILLTPAARARRKRCCLRRTITKPAPGSCQAKPTRPERLRYPITKQV